MARELGVRNRCVPWASATWLTCCCMRPGVSAAEGRASWACATVASAETRHWVRCSRAQQQLSGGRPAVEGSTSCWRAKGGSAPPTAAHLERPFSMPAAACWRVITSARPWRMPALTNPRVHGFSRFTLLQRRLL